MKISRKNIPWLFSLILFIFFINSFNKNSSLKRNLEFSNAVILEFQSGTRQRNYLNYRFISNGEKYIGTGRYYPNSDIFAVGDSILIVYDRANPENNKTRRDYDDLIFK